MTLAFKIEQQILDTWGILDDIDILTEAVLEKDLSKDQIANILIGLRDLHQLKFDNLFTTFEKLTERDLVNGTMFNGEDISDTVRLDWIEQHREDVSWLISDNVRGAIDKAITTEMYGETCDYGEDIIGKFNVQAW